MTSLSDRDLALLERAQRALLSPLDHGTPEAWLRHALEALRGAFHAERAVGTVGAGADAAVVALGVSPQALASYEAEFVSDDAAGDLVTAHPFPYYVEEDFAGSEPFRAHTRSVVYNEWYRPHGLTNALGFFVVGEPAFVPDLYDPFATPITANVLLAGSQLSAGAGAARARLFLSLLQPSLATSVRAWQRLARAAHHLSDAIDHLGATAWLFDRDGTLLHEAAGARRPVTPEVRAAAHAYARTLLAAERAEHPAPPLRAGSPSGPLLRATYLQAEAARLPALLLWLDETPTLLPSVEVLRERSGLTPQQARVALLLTERRSTGEIAEALCVSTHTVRHHVEQVLARLGVRERGEVAAVLQRAAETDRNG